MGADQKRSRRTPQEKLSPQDRKALRNIIGQGRIKPSE